MYNLGALSEEVIMAIEDLHLCIVQKRAFTSNLLREELSQIHAVREKKYVRECLLQKYGTGLIV